MYSGINLLGMALSLACVIIIFRYVYGEFSVDRFNKKLDRIYVTTIEGNKKPGEVSFLGVVNPNKQSSFVDMAKNPGVEKYSSFTCFNNDEINFDDRKYSAAVLVADSNFLKITEFPLISGIANMSDPKNALITKNFAQKVFGNENPVGKTFRYSNGEILTITGTIGQTSTKTAFSFDVIVSYYLTNDWTGSLPQTIILLHPGVDYRTINKQYEKFYDISFFKNRIRYQLFPLSKVYFDKNIDKKYIFKQGNYNYVSIFMTVGALILLVGAVNYINIYTVVILRRGRELGIKKVFGARGHNIFMQLMIENLFVTGLALILAFFIVNVAYPLITNVVQLDQISSIRSNMLLSFALLLCLPLLTTLYPFFRYHYFTVANSLHTFGNLRSAGKLRHIFLTFQYMITMSMIVVSLFFVKQLHFMMHTDPGYRTKDIIKAQFLEPKYDASVRISNEEWEMIQKRENRIADEISQKMNAYPLFSNWTYGKSPNEFSNREFLFKLPEGEYKNVNVTEADESWFRLFEIPLKEGRLWDDKTDDFHDYFLIVTESFLKLYGITDISNATLQPEKRIWWSPEEMKTNPPYRIVGVVKDFNYLHLSQKSEPIAFIYSKGYRDEPLIASIVPGRKQEAIKFLRNLHDETVGGEFSYSFVEDEIHEMYKGDRTIAVIYSIFTFIAIFISALGLFGMSLFDMQQRRKEIAIRKVNGALVSDIIRILLKKYFLLLAVSFVIAAPIALFAINRYLEGFANKAPVSWWLFAAALAITAGISLLTLIYQTVRAANQNPADVVKVE